MTAGYAEFLASKSQEGADSGFDPVWMPDFLFDFQASLTEWAIRRGRDAIFADCGLGKTPMELVWAENVARKTGGRVLILTALAVSAQMIHEAEKFGVEVHRSREGALHRITLTNYERLHLFSPADFDAVVCDESSILKSFDGERRGEITAFMRKVPYRLLATATAAPNDYIELGTSSEALGYLGHIDMLQRFFKNTQNTSSQGGGGFGAGGKRFGVAVKFRLKGHAEDAFWRWVCSWARAIRRPSDLGFDDSAFTLPPMTAVEHRVDAKRPADGMLFDLPAVTLPEQREELRRTLHERCEMVASLVNDTGQPALVWCHLNDEGDTLERMIPDAVQVSGNDSDDTKEGRLTDFAEGRARVLITKPKIGAWGLNFQHCAHVTFFPSHSFEQYYQATRRCWRFGQKRPVKVDLVTTEGQRGVLANMQRKSEQADAMFDRLVQHMNDALGIKRTNPFTNPQEVPSWL